MNDLNTMTGSVLVVASILGALVLGYFIGYFDGKKERR